MKLGPKDLRISLIWKMCRKNVSQLPMIVPSPIKTVSNKVTWEF